MMPEFIEFTKKEGVGIIVFNRPEAFNSFTVPMAKEVQNALDDCESDKDVRAILLTGNGRAFCAGQDLKEATKKDALSIGEIVDTTYNPIVTRLRSIEKPIVCAVNGVAAGAGANIAFACDITLAADSANFIQAFSSIGLIPDSGGTFTLPRLVGMQRATAQMFLAEKIGAIDAEDMGLIYKSVSDDELMEVSFKLAMKLAKRPTKALGLTKRLLNASFQNSWEEQLQLEKKLQEEAGQTHDNKEGIMAFIQKRKPEFIGS